MSEIQYTPLPEDQFSFKDIIFKILKFKNLLVSNWKTIVLVTVVGAVIGLAIDFFNKKPPFYTAKIVFNMENGGGGSAGGGLSDLASAFGINTGSAASVGLFAGENFLELLKTKNLYNRAILAKVKVNGKDVIFGNYYLQKSGIRDYEMEDDEELKTFQFKHNTYAKLTPKEKSKVRLIQEFLMPVTMIMNESRKASFMTLQVSTRNDTLSYLWANLYLKTVTDFYRETKTQKTQELLTLIERRVDSLRHELYATQGAAARFADQNQQIIVQQGLIQQQRLNTNSSQLQGMYFEAVRNLDNLKFSMVKESPLLTRIDDPELPISKDPSPNSKSVIIGGVLGFFLSILYFALRKTLVELSKISTT
ncbi:GumC domain-containing protein [Arcicella rigui]|uniref:Lipopolysaccharide biosynthesis protein n=1 Tax=Arcicella rigui TaxID=797020 RepID=A0ABU5QAH2_9BACT|nr:hypothetical protein [Arcicella rigui]MEA5139846.1 hypothetical protein [Arcicella rigui]